MKHQLELWKDIVGVQQLRNIYLVSDIIPPGAHLPPLLARGASFNICFLIYLSLLYEFHSQGVGFGLHLFAGSPEYRNIFDGVKIMPSFLYVAECCIIGRFISSRQIEF